LEQRQVLHVAQSRYHDIAPARAMGFRTAWINRPSARTNIGVVPAHPPGSEPDAMFPDLASLAAALVPAPQD
jgi:FMN phosphatase YigB (HAD superfamily)